MSIQKILARQGSNDPRARALEVFGLLCTHQVDAVYLDSSQQRVFAVAGLPRRLPVAMKLLQILGKGTLDKICSLSSQGVLLVWNPREGSLSGWCAESSPVRFPLTEDFQSQLRTTLKKTLAWGGSLTPEGIHQGDPRDPVPGPHFAVNLLIGHRIGFSHPLQTTPKSVVDRWGRGSFRSHAATQVLATRWDLRQEENGFPANRQFYLTENGTQIFYSAPGDKDDQGEVHYHHGPNWTKIIYKTLDKLVIERNIFILPYEPGQPLACEVQMVHIRNESNRPRKLRLVYTGMFGPSKPGALMEDVLYSNIIMQAGMLRNHDGTVRTILGDYQPLHDRQDIRFQTLRLYSGAGCGWPDEFGTDYNQFVGNGTLEHPEGLEPLDNHLGRKGPGFFALGMAVNLAMGERQTAVSFTGLVSSKAGGSYDEDTLTREVDALVLRYPDVQSLEQVLGDQAKALETFSSAVQFRTGLPVQDAYLNRNLPFQVFYQTFVSRSFCQTQKGYREIGFREIQDLFASMAYFCSGDQDGLVRELLGEWASHVHRFGFADHNFYWQGKEAGKWSDDPLWLVQAVSRFMDLTGDFAFLHQHFPVAGTTESRSLFDTLKAIVQYSGKISVGKHGIPLLDNADWNDCLKLDADHLDGPAKEKLYFEQIAAGKTRPGEPFQSDFTESVMNGFLLKLAADQLAEMAEKISDNQTAGWSRGVSQDMADNLQSHGWKGDYFSRLLLNRHPGRSYVGADGDGLSTDGTPGSHFLNSFSWAILSGTAGEDQIHRMYTILEKRMKTPFGYRLVSPMDLRRVEPQVASGEYFPGDRENGAVFKHASMMAAAALVQASSWVTDRELARKMAASAWWMVDLVLPYRTMADPFSIAGNPRFCTQYNNSETGENIGPLLSGTASWLTLVVHRAYGIQFRNRELVLDPLLREGDTQLEYTVVHQGCRYRIQIQKPVGFYRSRDSRPNIYQDGEPLTGAVIPVKPGQKESSVELIWE